MARNNHFGGFGGGANMQQLMRQAQKLQQQMTEAQENLDAAEYEAASGGGMVKVKVSGSAYRLPPNWKGTAASGEKDLRTSS